jgi:hypothetical protein
VKHSELERQFDGMGRELMRKLLQAHLDLRQPGKAVEAVRDAAGTPLTPTPVQGRSLESIFGTVEVARTGPHELLDHTGCLTAVCPENLARAVHRPRKLTMRTGN